MLTLEQNSNASLARKAGGGDMKAAPATKAGSKASMSRMAAAASTKSTRKEPMDSAKPPKTGCWHCQGAHWLKDCLTASADDRAWAVEKMREVKEKVRAKKVTDSPSTGEVVLNGLVMLPYVADLGADTTFIPRQALATGILPADDDPFDEEDEALDLSRQEIREKLDELLVAAGQCGFSPPDMNQLHGLVMEFEDVCRVDLGADTPADIEPLNITLEEGAKPFRARSRHYAPAQRQFLREYTARPEEQGFIRRNDQTHWTCAAVPVAKPHKPGEFRMTVNYRPVNAMTVPIAGAAQEVPDSAEAAKGACGYADFDMPKGFWRLPLHPDSQEMMSFVTTDTVYTPTRVPQGASDSALHFQSQMQKIFAPMLYLNLLVWVDGILVYAKTPDEFLDALRRLFTLVQLHRLKLSVAKSGLFKTDIKWYGRVFNGVGISHDPDRISALQSLSLPVTAADLQQFLCATGWMRDTLMDFSRTMQPLLDKLEGVLSDAGRTKKLAAGVLLSWTHAEAAAFARATQYLRSSQTLHFPTQSTVLCVFSDASERGWGLVGTQVAHWNDGRPAPDQQHELLVCKSGLFDPTAQRRSIIEKKAFPIIWAALHLEYLLVRPGGFHLYCDHKNLIYVFSPVHEVKRHVRGKLQRWALSLTGLTYQIEHIDGTANVWADLLSRWRAPSEEVVGEEHQAKYRNAAPPAANRGKNGNIVVEDRIWIPSAATELLQRIMVVAHCGSQGHRGLDPMVTTIKETFEVDSLGQCCRRFLKRRLLCKHVKGGNIIPRPWGPTYNPTLRNELLPLLGGQLRRMCVSVVLKDGLSHFCELVACDSATSTVAATTLADWTKRFGPPEVLVSDQGSHFRMRPSAKCARACQLNRIWC
ncbi:unnamed protein product [Phytophthora fragariaefolia]|uniref:Unnamed protein product n=1 Tax=Phytophthora fragariaefolia TaxID=1490495 RepID=A0A9W6TPN8_9STRA|nr:unnamed protein product [Phytophthora fragariaefolia]